jgi:hypothetical protein
MVRAAPTICATLLTFRYAACCSEQALIVAYKRISGVTALLVQWKLSAHDRFGDD